VSEGIQFDEEASRRVEAIYSTPDVVAQRRAVLQALDLCPGERVLDIGSGPGFLAADSGLAVGESGRVCGIDISESMIAISRRRCAHLSHVEFHHGNATQLPFPDGDFDVAVSTQVYEYLTDRDVTSALTELYRVLRPGGRVLVLDTDGDSLVWHATDRTRMARVLAAWEDHCADFHLPAKLSPKLAQIGFSICRRDIIPIFNPEFDPNTYSVGLMRTIVDFTPGKRGVTREEVEAWAEDLRRLGEEGSYFFSLNRYLFLAIKSVQPDRN
jgi:arsenite methyltransferase